MLTAKMSPERIANLPESDWRKTHPWFNPPQLKDNLALASHLQEVGKPYGASAAEVAIAWTLHHPAVSGAIVGMRHPRQVADLSNAASVPLDDETIAKLNSFLGSQ